MRRSGLRLVRRVLAFSALVLLLAACSSIGPRTMDRDQLNYGASIGNNWKNQMLLNIVRTRYFDMPVFVDVTSIVSGYSLETQVNAAVGFGGVHGPESVSIQRTGYEVAHARQEVDAHARVEPVGVVTADSHEAELGLAAERHEREVRGAEARRPDQQRVVVVPVLHEVVAGVERGPPRDAAASFMSIPR